MKNHFEYLVENESECIRVDIFLAEKFKGKMSRTSVKKAIKSGALSVNGKKVSPHYILSVGDKVLFEAIEVRNDYYIKPDNIPLDIIYEDNAVIVLNKPPGLVVHPAPGNRDKTLVNALKYYLGASFSAGGDGRAGIVHRLDKYTSGVMIVAKRDDVHRELVRQFKERIVKKEYIAVLKGIVQHDEMVVDAPISKGHFFAKRMKVDYGGGKKAFTRFYVQNRFLNFTLVKVLIETGRTHQIRVHAAHTGYPVLGDSLYGATSSLISRPALHSYGLGIMHPDKKDFVFFSADMPYDMKKLLKKIES